jgi:hypothetical protein
VYFVRFGVYRDKELSVSLCRFRAPASQGVHRITKKVVPSVGVVKPTGFKRGILFILDGKLSIPMQVLASRGCRNCW